MHKAGIIAQTHTTSVESLRQGIEAGVDMMQHAASTGPTPIPDSTIQLVLDREDVSRRPAADRAAPRDRARSRPRSGIPTDRTRFNERVRHENQIRLIKAHVPLLLATDAGMTDPDARRADDPQLRIDRLTELGEGHFLWFHGDGRERHDADGRDRLRDPQHRRGVPQARSVRHARRRASSPTSSCSTPIRCRTSTTSGGFRRVIKDGQVVDRDKLPLKRVLTAARDRHTSSEE